MAVEVPGMSFDLPTEAELRAALADVQAQVDHFGLEFVHGGYNAGQGYVYKPPVTETVTSSYDARLRSVGHTSVDGATTTARAA